MTPATSSALFLLLAASLQSDAAPDRPGLAYSKVFGGSGADSATAVATGPDGAVYVAGTTSSGNFPVENGFQQHMGGTPLRISSDGGQTWSAPQVGPGVLCIAACAQRPGCYYAGTAAGVSKSTDAGATWTRLASFPPAVVSALVVDPADPTVVYAASDRGILKSQDSGATWNLSNHGLEDASDNGGTGFVYALLAAHPGLPSRLYAAFGSGLYRSVDSAASWQALSKAPTGATSIAFDLLSPDILYVATGYSGEVFKTSDGGETWRKLSGASASNLAGAIAIGSDAIYLATTRGVLRSADGGATWAAAGITTPVDIVATDTTHPQVLYAVADRVYVSRDRGTSWSPILSPVAGTVRAVAVLGDPSPSIFVGCDSPTNAFVTKWSSDGTRILYSTYLGGSFAEYLTGIAVDREGNAYVTGFTSSPDFPVTPGALQRTLAGSYNAFVTKISADGSTLLYSTFLGGSGGDSSNAIALDGGGNAYITGFAASADFPVTSGALQRNLNQNCPQPPENDEWFITSPVEGDAFVAKIASDGTALLYSTLLGGSCADEGYGVAVDSDGSALVAGVTNSPDFPVTAGALKITYPGASNTGFVAKLNPQGSAIQFASFVGGPGDDVAQAVALDSQHNVYITGSSYGLDDWVIPFGSCTTAYQEVGSSFTKTAGGSVYLLKLNPEGSSAIYKQYLGGCTGTGGAVSVDAAGRAWIVGSNLSPPGFVELVAGNWAGLPDAFPTVHPFQALGLGWGFVAEFSADGSTTLFSSLLDTSAGLALDSNGNAFVAAGTAYWTDSPGLSKQGEYGAPSLPNPSALVVRIDAAVSAELTIEAPQKTANTPYRGLGPLAVLAPGSFMVLTGTGLGPIQEVGASFSPDGTLSTSLAGTSVTFDGIPAPLLSVQAQKITCIVPFELAPRNVTVVQVRRNELQSNSIRVLVSPLAPEILAVTNEDGTPNSADHPAPAQSTVTIYAAGLGQTDPPSQDGIIESSAFGKPTIPVSVWVPPQSAAQILYVGPSPGSISGLTQINVRVPQLASGRYTMLVGTGNTPPSVYDSATLVVK